MNLIKLATISITRTIARTFVLLMVFFILGNLIMGALVIQQAIDNTKENVFARIPAIATIITNWTWIHSVSHEEQLEYSENLSQDVIHKIGSSPYVFTYNILLEPNHIFPMISSELVRSPELSIDVYSLREIDQIRIRDPWSANNWSSTQNSWENFFLRGIYFSEEIADIYFGLMAINEGRNFSPEELTNGSTVTLISRQLANANNLQIGSVFSLTNSINNSREGVNPQEFELEVIGIFDLNTEFFDYENYFYAFEDEFRQINRIHVPLLLAEEIERYNFLFLQETDPWFRDFEFEESISFNSVFILNNPRYLNDFIEEANFFLPYNFIVEGVATYVFGSLNTSMENMLWLVEMILYTTIIASIIITSLVILLFLNDRKEEIGIYLALGRKKILVSAQILLEVGLIALISITISIFSGNLLANSLSQQMLEAELTHYEQQRINFPGGSINNPFDILIYSPPRMSQEEMIEAFDLTVPPRTIGYFYIVSISTILLSILLPITYLTKLDPKKILM